MRFPKVQCHNTTWQTILIHFPLKGPIPCCFRDAKMLTAAPPPPLPPRESAKHPLCRQTGRCGLSRRSSSTPTKSTRTGTTFWRILPFGRAGPTRKADALSPVLRIIFRHPCVQARFSPERWVVSQPRHCFDRGAYAWHFYAVVRWSVALLTSAELDQNCYWILWNFDSDWEARKATVNKWSDSCDKWFLPRM